MKGLTALPLPVLRLLPPVSNLQVTEIYVKLSFIFIFRSVHTPANNKRPTRHLVTYKPIAFI